MRRDRRMGDGFVQQSTGPSSASTRPREPDCVTPNESAIDRRSPGDVAVPVPAEPRDAGRRIPTGPMGGTLSKAPGIDRSQTVADHG